MFLPEDVYSLEDIVKALKASEASGKLQFNAINALGCPTEEAYNNKVHLKGIRQKNRFYRRPGKRYKLPEILNSGGKYEVQQRRKSDVAGRLEGKRGERVGVRESKRAKPADVC